jgi:hypothetical protein
MGFSPGVALPKKWLNRPSCLRMSSPELPGRLFDLGSQIPVGRQSQRISGPAAGEVSSFRLRMLKSANAINSSTLGRIDDDCVHNCNDPTFPWVVKHDSALSVSEHRLQRHESAEVATAKDTPKYLC